MEEKLQKTKTTCRILSLIILIISIAFIFLPIFTFEEKQEVLGIKINTTAEFSVWQLITMDENVDLTYDIKDLEIDVEDLDNDTVSMVKLLDVEEEKVFLKFYRVSVLCIAIPVVIYGVGVLFSVIINKVKMEKIKRYIFAYGIFISIVLLVVDEVLRKNTLDCRYIYVSLLILTIIILKCVLESKFKKQQTISVSILGDRYKSESLSWYKLFAADIYTFVDNANLDIDHTMLGELIQIRDRKEFKQTSQSD